MLLHFLEIKFVYIQQDTGALRLAIGNKCAPVFSQLHSLTCGSRRGSVKIGLGPARALRQALAEAQTSWLGSWFLKEVVKLLSWEKKIYESSVMFARSQGKCWEGMSLQILSY
jgi:hypothetical protein